MNNPYLIVPIVAWVVGQVAKFCFYAIKGDVRGRYLYASGGMPSTHAAIVGALAITALLEDGVNSAGFGISAVLALIVMVDAVNVRRAVGENRQAIKTLYKLVPMAKRRTDDDDVLDRSAALGHTPVEVLAGVFVGALTAYGMLYSTAASLNWGLKGRPVGTEQTIYYVVFIAMIVITVLLSAITWTGSGKRLQTARRLRAAFRGMLLYPAVTGLLLLWAQDEGIDLLAKRWLVWVTLTFSFMLGLWYFENLFTHISEEFAADKRQRAQSKKLRRKKRRKR